MSSQEITFVLRFRCSSKLAAFPWSYVTAKLDEGSGGGETFFFLDSFGADEHAISKKSSSSLSKRTGLILEHSFSLPVIEPTRKQPPSFLYLHLFAAWTDPGSNMLVCKTLQTTRLALVAGGKMQTDVNLCGRKGLLQVSQGRWGQNSDQFRVNSPSPLPTCSPIAREALPELNAHLKRAQDFFYRGKFGALPWKVKSDAGNNVSNEITPVGPEVPGDLYLYMLSQQALEVGLKHLEREEEISRQQLYWIYCFRQACLRLACGPRFLTTILAALPTSFDAFVAVLATQGTRLDSARLCMEIFVNMICFPCVIHNYSADLCPDLGGTSSKEKATPSFFSGTSSSLQEIRRRQAGTGVGAGRKRNRIEQKTLSIPCEKFEPMIPGLGRTDDCESLSMRTLINYTHFMAWTRKCDLRSLFRIEPLLTCCIVVLHEHYQLLWMQVIIDLNQKDTDSGKELPLGPQPETGPLKDFSLAEQQGVGYIPTQEDIEANTAHVTLGLAPRKRILPELDKSSARRGGGIFQSAQRFYLLESTAQFLGDNFWDDPQGGLQPLSQPLKKFYAKFTDSRLLRIDTEVCKVLGAGNRVVNVGNSYQWAQGMYLRVCNFLTFPFTEGRMPPSVGSGLPSMRWQVPCRLDAAGEKVQSGVSFGQFVAWASAPTSQDAPSVFVSTQDAVQYSSLIVDTTLREWKRVRPPLGEPLTLPREQITAGLRTLGTVRKRVEAQACNRQREVIPVSCINYLTCAGLLCRLGQNNKMFSEIPFSWPLLPARRDDGWYWREEQQARKKCYSVHYLVVQL